MSIVSCRNAWRGVRNGRAGWWLVTPYSAELVAHLKALPVSDRVWDPQAGDAGAWWIAAEQAAVVAVLVPGFEAFLKQAPLF